MRDYRQQGALFSWIKRSPPEDRHWARAYLQGKGIILQPDAFEPSGSAPIFPNDAHHREIDLKLSNALRQRRARRKLSGRKAYNFVLSLSAKRKLDEIAEAMFTSITEALTNFIEHEHQRIDHHKKALKVIGRRKFVLRSSPNLNRQRVTSQRF